MNIPKSWRDIKLKQFQQLAPNIIISGDMTTLQYSQYWLKICEILELEIDNLNRGEFQELINQLAFLQEDPKTLNFKFTHDGIDYGFNNNPEKWNVAEYMDFDVYASGKTQAEIIDNLDKIVAIFFRPIEKKSIKNIFRKGEIISDYYSSDLEGRAELFKEHLPADIAYSICIFFSLFVSEFINIGTLSSLQTELRNL